MRRAEKEQVVAKWRQAIDEAAHIILSGYRGLTVKEITELRRRIREAGGRMRVVKKTLFQRALEGQDESALGEHMEGPIAVTFVSGDPMTVLKAMHEFARDHDQLDFRASWIEDELLQASQVEELAILPPRDELLGRLAAVMSAPLAQLAAVLQAVPRDFVLTLQAVAKQREGEAAA